MQDIAHSELVKRDPAHRRRNEARNAKRPSPRAGGVGEGPACRTHPSHPCARSTAFFPPYPSRLNLSRDTKARSGDDLPVAAPSSAIFRTTDQPCQ